jgi:putative acetyltransferase
VTCRPAIARDIPWLVETSLATYGNVFAPLLRGFDMSVFGASFFAERFGRDWQKVRVAVLADQPTGFCMMTDGNIDMLFVAGGQRSAGCGKLLLEDAEARGARSLECFAANLAARRFYERHGWIPAAGYARVFAGSNCAFLRYVKKRARRDYLPVS